jgi:hypothetical protein
VRMILVPAIMTLLGKHAWWMPRWLEPVVPHLQLEGSDAGPQPAMAGGGTSGESTISEGAVAADAAPDLERAPEPDPETEAAPKAAEPKPGEKRQPR